MAPVLSNEQEAFIQAALAGNNILVDACIGSGKTTAIQRLCDALPTDKSILYLTYNKLLKVDAQSKIHNRNVTVTNYHGFAYGKLMGIDVQCGISEIIQNFIIHKPPMKKYDVLILDEYQDINEELSEMLWIIKDTNPDMQVIAVGDMEQKIYDHTTLQVHDFIEKFLGEHMKMEFTKCFRLSYTWAKHLGDVWKKAIVGVNTTCKIEYMTLSQAQWELAMLDPSQILCLGANSGQMVAAMNWLEANYPKKFNKNTVYASISNVDRSGNVQPTSNTAIFTTFDSSKGLERPVCVVFDFTENYWGMRAAMPNTNYEILRNIFCVAASRGKERIIIVKDHKQNGDILSFNSLKTPFETRWSTKQPQPISGVFDFKYKEDVDACFKLLKAVPVPQNDTTEIVTPTRDKMIDLSPCIGIFQEAIFFSRGNYNLDNTLAHLIQCHPKREIYAANYHRADIESKVLILTTMETGHVRYTQQVDTPFVLPDAQKAIKERLGTVFTPDEKVQVQCDMWFAAKKDGPAALYVSGLADVVKDDIVYELKFVSELSPEHYLQCAMYMLALGLEKGRLWNVRTNEMYEITIPSKKKLLDAIARTISKRGLNEYFHVRGTANVARKSKKQVVIDDPLMHEYFAVLDASFTWDKELMSFGVVIADKYAMKPVAAEYYIIESAARKHGPDSDGLYHTTQRPVSGTRQFVMQQFMRLLSRYKITDMFTYSRHDREYWTFKWVNDLCWYDIERIEYAIAEKRGYPPEDMDRTKMYQVLTGTLASGVDNALTDAIEELTIMQKSKMPYTEFADLRYWP
ncbi:MAG: AAA family ATPase [Bacteroidaceae bacterium]|nr:AAA family ATPase [Bacteroidaceae bacterium]